MCIVVFAIGFMLVVIATQELWIGLFKVAAARKEYARLRELSGGKAAATEQSDVKSDLTLDSLDGLSEINPDFIGWITVTGTEIDYPVVRGKDNERYLHTTFNGAANPAGTIFMDYRCNEDFNTSVCLLHGHNMRDGAMFSPLLNYLDQEFMNDNPEIIILTVDGRRLVYRIFQSRRTDIWDSAYTLKISDIEYNGQVLILSTCLYDTDLDARLLVFAVLEAN